MTVGHAHVMTPLAGDNAHVWLMDTSSPAWELAPGHSSAILSSDELQQCHRFRREAGRRQFVMARTGLRWLLSLYCPQVRAKDWQFDRGKNGRPELSSAFDNINAPSFNLSHSGDCVVLVFSRAGTAGVDVEPVNRPRVNLGIARRYFSRQEVSALESLPTDSQQLRFLMLWTLKEASSKALGGSLGPALRSHVFDFPDTDRIRFSGDGNWQFWQFLLPGGYLSALAVNSDSPVSDMRCQFYRFEWPDSVSELSVKQLRSSS